MLTKSGGYSAITPSLPIFAWNVNALTLPIRILYRFGCKDQNSVVRGLKCVQSGSLPEYKNTKHFFIDSFIVMLQSVMITFGKNCGDKQDLKL